MLQEINRNNWKNKYFSNCVAWNEYYMNYHILKYQGIINSFVRIIHPTDTQQEWKVWYFMISVSNSAKEYWCYNRFLYDCKN